jgi:hypothetical protein
MNRANAFARILKGAKVVTADGDVVGIVMNANAGYFEVGSRAMATDYFIPNSAIARAKNKLAELNVSRAELLASGWERGQATHG